MFKRIKSGNESKISMHVQQISDHISKIQMARCAKTVRFVDHIALVLMHIPGIWISVATQRPYWVKSKRGKKFHGSSWLICPRTVLWGASLMESCRAKKMGKCEENPNPNNNITLRKKK